VGRLQCEGADAGRIDSVGVSHYRLSFIRLSKHLSPFFFRSTAGLRLEKVYDLGEDVVLEFKPAL
jgi:hypothetical protein